MALGYLLIAVIAVLPELDIAAKITDSYCSLCSSKCAAYICIYIYYYRVGFLVMACFQEVKSFVCCLQCLSLNLNALFVMSGTLAYGINMPCRTVAFAGDHIFLNSLQFCQMSGRAGRRGFDTLGHVVFMEVPQRKVASLMVSPVPQLHGNFPLSVTLALRALTLQGAVTDDPEVTNDLLRLLQKPFYASEDPAWARRCNTCSAMPWYISGGSSW